MHWHKLQEYGVIVGTAETHVGRVVATITPVTRALFACGISVDGLLVLTKSLHHVNRLKHWAERFMWDIRSPENRLRDMLCSLSETDREIAQAIIELRRNRGALRTLERADL